jgi:hypothetical protein
MARLKTCLLNGKHNPGSEWEAECPLRNADKRSERARRNALAGWARRRRHPLAPARPDTLGES